MALELLWVTKGQLRIPTRVHRDSNLGHRCEMRNKALDVRMAHARELRDHDRLTSRCFCWIGIVSRCLPLYPSLDPISPISVLISCWQRKTDGSSTSSPEERDFEGDRKLEGGGSCWPESWNGRSSAIERSRTGITFHSPHRALLRVAAGAE